MFVANADDPGFGRGRLIIDQRQQPRLQRKAQRLDILKAQRAAPRLFDQGQVHILRGAKQLGHQLLFTPSRA